ncbi:hypothetical protein CEXT_430351 [Caerostris extrusa]|uniref:C2H2-type domain-containing protein n=1 Tax=Caerostris extrusa TaxID=172846 RepID=A0AAV4TJH7_CAEEX|nr:hypothetical protein CEXT_430351 [Caerostris extrusa]
MSEDEKIPGSFRYSLEDEKEDQTLLETLPRVPATHHMQNLLAGENVGDGSHEPSSGLFHRMLDPRNSTWNAMRAAGEQEAVRSPEKLQQSSEYSLLQPTLNKSKLSNTNSFLSGSCMWNKKMRSCENIPNEDSCQPLDMNMKGAPSKTDVVTDSENSHSKMIQSDIFTGSPECSSSALSSSNSSRNQEEKHVCDVCKMEFTLSCALSRHKFIHTGTCWWLQKNVGHLSAYFEKTLDLTKCELNGIYYNSTCAFGVEVSKQYCPIAVIDVYPLVV